jgi:hypothetical protein
MEQLAGEFKKGFILKKKNEIFYEKFGLMIEGEALYYIFSDKKQIELLLEISDFC